MFYDSIAHELLHYGLRLKNQPLKAHHCLMLNKGYYDRTTRYIEMRLRGNGMAQLASTTNLTHAYFEQGCGGMISIFPQLPPRN
jgi:hypothetical protein